jgi:hypothetical protein
MLLFNKSAGPEKHRDVQLPRSSNGEVGAGGGVSQRGVAPTTRERQDGNERNHDTNAKETDMQTTKGWPGWTDLVYFDLPAEDADRGGLRELRRDAARALRNYLATGLEGFLQKARDRIREMRCYYPTGSAEQCERTARTLEGLRL